MPVHRPRRHHIGPIDRRTLIFVNRRRIAVVDRLIVAHRHGNATLPAAVQRGDDPAFLDMLDRAKHPVFHAKVAVVLQEHDAVAGRELPLSVIGLEGQRAGVLALRQLAPVL